MGLGPLVGTRTRGGVVGYYGWRPRLADGTFVSQPEISFHFDDVKWPVENHGAEPDVEIDYVPQHYARGVDPQLDKAIEVVLDEMARRPPPPRRPRRAPSTGPATAATAPATLTGRPVRRHRRSGPVSTGGSP